MLEIEETPAIEAKPAMKPYINRENAAMLQKKSVASRLGELARSEVVANEAETAERFRVARLVRVREMIEELDQQMKDAEKPSEKFQLANALDKLSDQEADLAGRIKPGVYKPQAPKLPKSSTFTPPRPADVA